MQKNVEQLWDLEEIKQLKARYFRFVDTKDWAGLRSLFTEDAAIDITDTGDLLDPDAFVRRASERIPVRTSVSVHHGHMPEIRLDGVDTAMGIWAMFDYVDRPEDGERHAFHGYGYYHETYRKSDGEWKIASLRLERIRRDEIPPIGPPISPI